MIKTFQIYNKNENCKVELREQVLSPTLSEWHISVRFAAPTVPSTVSLKGYYPCRDIYTVWGPSMGLNPSLGYSWSKRTTSSRLASGAPIHVLLSQSGKNRLTFALSDAATPHEIATGVLEEDGTLECSIRLFTRPISAITSYEVTLRVDTADRPFYESVAEVENWWAEKCGYPRAYVPEAAKLPLYSAWYSFHQRTIPSEIVEQCKMAKELGMDVLIVDDGWQTDDGNRGYAFCGDWEVCPAKIPDMKAFVDAVHALDMKFMLWYSVPFVGTQSKMYKRFSDKVLGHYSGHGDLQWTCLDPRYPDVREALIDIYRRAMLDWGLDGFKLDFIDSFRQSAEVKDGMDYVSVYDAVDRLMKDVLATLKAQNPDVKIIAVEPASSAILSGVKAGSHKIQGIGAGFIPKTLDTEIYDEVIAIRDEDALCFAREIAASDGILVGISSGAALCAARELATREENKGKNIVVLLPDTGERYLSSELFEY